MCQAAAEGAVDFSRADPRNPHWWMKLRIVLDQVEARNLIEVTKLNHATTAALLSRGDLTEDSINKLRDNAERLVTRVKKERFPWVQFDDQAVTQQVVERMSRMWAETWGDPDDPATRAKIDATVAMMERQNTSSRRAA